MLRQAIVTLVPVAASLIMALMVALAAAALEPSPYAACPPGASPECERDLNPWCKELEGKRFCLGEPD